MTDFGSGKSPEAISNPSIVAMLSEIRELVHDLGVTSCERTDYGWTLDSDEEFDRKALLVFTRAGLTPENPTHRDLLLEYLIESIAVSGTPGWGELDMRGLVRDVYYTSLALKHLNEPSSRLNACDALAKQPFSTIPHRKYPGNHASKTLLRRFYTALDFFRRRLKSDRFRRDWTSAGLDELKIILKYFEKRKRSAL